MSAAEKFVIPFDAKPSAEAMALVADGMMTVREAAAFSGICRSDLYCYMERGELPYGKNGRRRLIPRKAVQELMAKILMTSKEG